jgi:peptidoglycan/xylan/chitin deacetylase (PgdA/CDA1 family)
MTRFSRLLLALCALDFTAHAQLSPPTVKPPTEATKLPDGTKVMRAIPIEEPPVIDVAALPHTLPEDVKVAYSQCHVEGNVIAITFDDGPHPQNTPRLLDMLKERGIKATFFLIGKSAATWPALVKRIVDEGHEVANHTWTHPQLSHLKQTSVLSELQKTHDAIEKACGVAPILYRPPYGAITISQRKAIHDQFKYPTIVWDVDPLDWRSPRSSTKTHDRILEQVRSGSIILCHDIHAETVDAMPATLDDLKARGYQFATVTQLLNLDSQTAAKRANPPSAVPVTVAIDGKTTIGKPATVNSPPSPKIETKPAIVPTTPSTTTVPAPPPAAK